ncbi:MAG: PKD domain-containing protein [Acidobacteria bacterium]|nr:PKD domain-containing protein [Acidobacteriota bacterium]
MASAPTAQAQRLLTLLSGVGEAASVGGPGPSIGPVPTAVQVDLELLRAAPVRLEVPTPDGSVLSAEQSVFEDRGGGDLMWSGGQPEAGYDTVVLTVEGGRLVGRFGAAGGGVYQIHAERDGRGGMAPIVGPGLDAPEPWCAVEAGAEDGQGIHAQGLTGAYAADLPQRVSNPQSHDRLDILVAYTATAAANWTGRGGAQAAIRHAGDYLKMVFRNNDLPVEPHIVHIAQASTALDRAGRDLGWHERQTRDHPLWVRIDRDGELLRLRHEHRADLVHLFTGESPLLLWPACGSARLLRKGEDAQVFSHKAYGWTTNHSLCGDYAVVFAHEIGHGLGAHHDPPNAGSPPTRFRPYALGYANFDVMPSVGTAMSYRGQVEPFFSTARIRPYGAVVGIAGEQDQERLLQETLHIGVRYSDYLMSLEGLPAAPSGLRAWFDGASVRLAWRDNAPDADGYELGYRVLRDDQWSAESLVTLEDRTEATLPMEWTEPGGLYEFWVRAAKGERRSLRSGIATLAVPAEPIEAPSDVFVTVAPPELGWVEVHWTDNSDSEAGFDVQLLRDGEVVDRNQAAADSARSEFHSRRGALQGGAEYEARVFAYNSSGYSESSETATFRWTIPDAPQPVTDLVVSATGPTTARVTWVDNSESDFYFVAARLPGWHDGFYVRDGVGRADLESLARGGRYTFEVHPSGFSSAGALASRFPLTLGQRGTGPRAPSDLSWAMTDDGRVRVSWKDNSSDELGFEVQSSTAGSDSWKRLSTVPPDTESVAVSHSLLVRNLRVFAYNERGFSASAPQVPGVPNVVWMTATAGDGEVCLFWTVSPEEWATRMQVRWKPTAALPFDDTVDTWTDLPALGHKHGMEYIVPGLENGTEYTFAVRAATALGAGPAKTLTATPLALRKASFRLDIPCGEELCRTVTGAPVSFVDTSGGTVTERRWSFGDGAGSDQRSPTHAWSSPGYYDVTLTVSDGSSSGSVTRTVLVEAAVRAGSCQADPETLCLQDSRFEVKLDWWSAAGQPGAGRVVQAGTNVAGLFRFSDSEDWEVLIKVLDGCAINERIWVMGASTTGLGYRVRFTDTVTGESRSYAREPGGLAPVIVDREAFSGGCGAVTAAGAPSVGNLVREGTSGPSAQEPEASMPAVVASEQVTGWCEADPIRLCLHNRRFEVQAGLIVDGEYKEGRVARAGTDEFGIFYLSDPENWEVLVKVLDGCAINGHYWVLAAAASDQWLSLAVVNRVGGLVGVKGYAARSRPIVDTEAFPGPCAAGSSPRVENLTATAGDAEVSLTWLAPYVETVTGMQARWKASADLPFDDAVDAWTELPAAAREYTVRGLRNDTEYTFAVHALTAFGAGPDAIVTATPRYVPPRASFVVNVECADDPCRVRTGEEIRFTDTSTGDVKEWHWSFGDGTTSDLKSPTHAWSSPGLYDVTLTVSDGSTSDSATRAFLVETPPRVPLKASFRLDIPCEEDLCRTFTDAPVSFVDTSGGNVTEWRWSFGDGATSNLRSPTHAWSTPGFYDVTLTVGDGSASDSATRTVLVEAVVPAGSCRFDSETLCLQDSRFEVRANWWSGDGESGPGRVVYAGTNDSGLFRFFDPLNWEILIKVLDGCGINRRMWVLGAATTDLGYGIVVTDTVTGESRSYENEPGRPAPAIIDTDAFSRPCDGGEGH